MREEQEFSGKTVEEATERALAELGVARDQIEVVVLKKGRSGLLGIGAEEARVKVVPKGQPEDEADVAGEAQRVLEEMLRTMRVEAQVKQSQPLVPGSGVTAVTLDIRGDDLGILIGRRGQTLSSLQYVVNLIVSHGARSRVPVVLDVEGYRERRYRALEELAKRMAERALSTGQPITMEPMPANERRIVHLALREYPNVTSESQGEGEGRKVTIVPRRR